MVAFAFNIIGNLLNLTNNSLETPLDKAYPSRLVYIILSSSVKKSGIILLLNVDWKTELSNVIWDHFVSQLLVRLIFIFLEIKNI